MGGSLRTRLEVGLALQYNMFISCNSPFHSCSQAVVIGNSVYLSGQIGINPEVHVHVIFVLYM